MLEGYAISFSSDFSSSTALAYEKSVRPTPFLNKVSPTKRIVSSGESERTKVTLPGVWPGVSIVVRVYFPKEKALCGVKK